MVVSIAHGAASAFHGAQRLFTIAALTFFLSVILLHAAVVSIQAKSIEPGLRDIGQRFASQFGDLDDVSQKIIAQGGVYDASAPVLHRAGQAVWNYLLILAPLSMIYIWVLIFAKLFEYTLSDSTSYFRNYLLGGLTFLVIQIIYLLYVNTDPDRVSVLMQPFLALWHLIQAIPHLISPIAEQIHRVESSEIANSTIAKVIEIRVPERRKRITRLHPNRSNTR